MEVGTTYYDRRTTHAPFVKVGYEHSRLATELAAEWDGINFEIVDGRTVRTNRFSIGGGFDSTVPLTPDVTLLWRGFLQLNADLSRARGSYFTEQTANFSTTVNGTASDFAITPGAGIQLGINRAFPNGAEGWLRGELEVGSFPRLRYRINGSPTISRAYHHSYRFSLGIRY